MLGVAALIAVTLVPVAADAQSLDQVRERRAELQQELDAAAETLAELETERALLEERTATLDRQLSALEAEARAAEQRIADRVRALYKRGSTDPVVMLLTGRDPDEAIDRATTIRQLVTGDRVDTEAARNAGTRMSVVATELRQSRERLAAASAEQQDLTAGLEDDLAEAQELEEKLEAEERRRREEEARRAAAAAAAREAEARRAASASSSSGASSGGGSSSGGSSSGGSGGGGSTSGGKACPMARPHSFTNTWGAPRSGGRSHKGTDILGPRGQTVIAIVDGVWDIMPRGNSAGLWAILKGSDGNAYWYLHLQSHSVGDGARVRAGQQVGTNGDTGNARGTTPHVHFELHPGGGGAVNPYPMLKRLCG